MTRLDLHTNTPDQAAAYERANAHDDSPGMGDVVDEWPSVRDPRTRVCVARWVSHGRVEFECCDYCQGRKPVCYWAGRDRCQHHRFIDDPGVAFDPIARRFYCDVYEQQVAS